MSTFVLIPGAGGAGRVYWSEVVAELAERGHVGIPVEIAEDNPALGLPEYAAITDAAIGDHDDVVLVAQSLGGFTAPMIDKLDRVSRVVFVNAMIPLSGETPGQWFEVTGADAARRAAAEAAGRSVEFDLETVFLHDIPEDVIRSMAEGNRDPAETPFAQPCTFSSWPDVPMHIVVGEGDRFFPADFQVRIARERLGLAADVLPGGHLIAKSRPGAIADQLVGYLGEVGFDLADAAAELARVARGVDDDQLNAATVCEGWTVRDLLAHLYDLPRAFAAVARHLDMPDPDQSTLPDDWRDHLQRGLDDLVEAWRAPSAWTGEHTGAGVTLPRLQWAQVALDELVVHACDLARATGQSFTAAEADVEVCTKFAEAFADLGERGPFGASLPAAPDASALDRLLALTGREPGPR